MLFLSDRILWQKAGAQVERLELRRQVALPSHNPPSPPFACEHIQKLQTQPILDLVDFEAYLVLCFDADLATSNHPCAT